MNHWEFEELKLLDCPFCGGKPEKIFIGNDHTKTRSIEIKCKACRVKRVDKALTHDHKWLDEVGTKAWNQRPINQQDK